MRPIERTTRFAIWARRLSFLSAMTMATAIVLRHLIELETGLMVTVLGAATLVALIAILFSFTSYVRIWSTGDRGWRRATYAIILSLIVVAPSSVALVRSFSYPQVFEVNSNLTSPVARLRPSGFTEPNRVQQILGEIELARYFPGVSPKIYPAEPQDVLEIVQGLARDNNWTILDQRADFSNLGEAHIHAVARSMVFLFEDDIHIRVRAAPVGAQVDVLSSSRFGNHDLGTNGRRIEAFFAALNKRMAGGLPEQLQETEADEETENAPENGS